MSNQDLKQQLHQKMQEEFSLYVESLKKESADRIINRAYEISIKKELIDLFEPAYLGDSFTDNEIQILLNTDTPLCELYISWIHCDLTYFDILEESCHNAISELKEYNDFYKKMNKAEMEKNEINAYNQKNIDEISYDK